MQIKEGKLAARFYEKHGLQNCVGIVDGMPVIFIQKPAEDGEDYFRFVYFSLLLVVCFA
jgi:hypothetical protein